MKKILLLLLVGLILGSMCSPVVIAYDEREPKGEIEADRIVMSTGMLTAVFEGKKPKITFYLTNTTERATEYKLNFKRLIEFDDLIRDGAYQSIERVAWAELEPLAWTHTAFYNLTGRTRPRIGIGINFTYSGPLQINRTGPPPETVANVTITFAVRIYQYNLTDIKMVGLQGFTYSVIGGAEVKVDLLLSGWPFGASENPMLALEIQLHSSHNRFEVEERYARRSVNANLTGVGELKMEQTLETEQKIRYLNATGEAVGFFKFVGVAIVKFAGESSLVDVEASYTGGRGEEWGQLKLFLAYPKFEGTLEHDPSFGIGEPGFPTTVEETIPEFPISATIVLILAMGAVTLILHILKRDRGKSIRSLRTTQS